MSTDILTPFLKAVQKWLEKHPESSWDELKEVFYQIIHQIAVSHRLPLPTLFSKLSFIINEYNIAPSHAWQLHHLRILFNQNNYQGSVQDVEKARKLCSNFINALLGQSPVYSLSELFEGRQLSDADEKWSILSVYLTRAKEDKLFFFSDLSGKQESCLQIDSNDEHLQKTLRLLRSNAMLPCEATLLDAERNAQGQFSTAFIVLQPNFLIDVSAIASCVDNHQHDAIKHVLKKLLPMPFNRAILLGNVVNQLFDELIYTPDLPIDEFIKRLFHKYPLALSLLDNHQLRQFLSELRNQYFNLKNKFIQRRKELGFDPKDCYVEPGFISPTYGLQGRLDAFYLPEQSNQQAKIIELKSGKIYKPNRYGLNANHYAQTLLYELLTKAMVNKTSQTVSNYILYSRTNEKTLKYAPSTRNMLFDLLMLRNEMLALEFSLQTVRGWISAFKKISSPIRQATPGFTGRDYKHIHQVFASLSPSEKDYLLENLAFLSREQWSQKTGSSNNRPGQAALWLLSENQKREQFRTLSYLTIQKNESGEDPPLLYLNYSEKTPTLSSLRRGDIIVLYPQKYQGQVASTQLFKASIVALEDHQVVIKLRARQRNARAFNHRYWLLEPDYLDSQIQRNSSGLFSLMTADPEKRKELLFPSGKPMKENNERPPKFEGTNEQKQILDKYTRSQNFFLLWGPPGTGKTSIMLRQMVEWVVKNSQENILLLGYTNRAVDEICRALDSLDCIELEKEALRIGSRYGTDREFQHLLLQNKSNEFKDRQQLKSILKNVRVVCGTLASISSQAELFYLKQFQRLIVDEASQILEPQIIGLLPRFDHFCLIGDHHQLPAIVTQDEQNCAYQSSRLRQAGYRRLSESLFGRMFRQLVNGHHIQNYAMLKQQGRMHEDISQLVSELFYNHQLSILPPGIERSIEQKKALNLSSQNEDRQSELHQLLSTNRLVFLHSPANEEFNIKKSCPAEARLIKKALKVIKEIKGKDFNPEDIGIITPFKAQIATIRKELSEEPDLKIIKTDTVERYQGGSKSIVILSMAVQSSFTLRQILNENEEGIERKLNVAISRAREQFICIGDARIAKTHPAYKALWQRAKQLKNT